MNNITRDGLPGRLRALAEDEIKGVSAVLSPGNSHDLLTAADEIERLRLTDAEREAIAEAIACCEDITYGGEAAPEAAATLRNLLKRMTL